MLISTQRVQTAHFKHISLKKLFVSVTVLLLFWTKNSNFFYFILEKSVFSESCTKRDCTPLGVNPGVKIMLFSPLGAIKMAENDQKWKNGRRQKCL